MIMPVIAGLFWRCTMNMADIIAILIIAVLFFSACIYLYLEKKKGNHCIGCPSAGKCPYRNTKKGPCSRSIENTDGK